MTRPDAAGPRARAFAGLIAALAALTLALAVGERTAATGEGAFAALWSVCRSFDVIVTLAICAVAATCALGGRVGPQVQGALVLAVGAAAAVHHLILSATPSRSELGALVDETLHTVLPVLYAVHWLIAAPKAGLRYGLVPLWLIFPLAYCGYALLRGEIDGIYPYPFLDAGAEGIYAVTFNIGFLLGVLWIEGMMIVALGRLIRRFRL